MSPNPSAKVSWWDRIHAVFLIIFYFPMELLRFGPRGAIELSFHEFRLMCGNEPLKRIGCSELTTEEGLVRVETLALDGYSGTLIKLEYRPALRPHAVSELVFWKGENPPMSEDDRDLAESLGLPHAPRSIQSSSRYTNSLIMSEELRERIEAALEKVRA